LGSDSVSVANAKAQVAGETELPNTLQNTQAEGIGSQLKAGAQVRRSSARALLNLPSERLIALARLALAAFAYLAIYMDPSQPARNSEITYALLFAYLVYSGLVVILVFRFSLHPSVQWVLHLVDIVTFSLLMHFTDGPTSPFFVFFTFALLTAMLRWDWPGVMVTTLVLVGMLMLVSYTDPPTGNGEIDRLLLRATYLLIAGATLAYASAVRQRDRVRLAKLAAWPHEEISASEQPAIAASLRHAAEIIGARRTLVVWDDGKEPHFEIAHWDGQRCAFMRWDNAGGAFVIEPSLQDTTFLASHGGAMAALLRSGLRQLPMPVLAADFAAAFGIERFSCAPFAGQFVRGWSLILDPPASVEGLHSLSEILSRRIGAELEHFYLRVELTQAAVVRERERLARDMHDGILQNLTAAGLQLNNIAGTVASPVAARLRDVGGLLGAQQQNIREFVHALNPKSGGTALEQFAPQLRVFANKVGEQWDCAVETRVTPSDLCLPARLVTELWLMLSEATANAVRHGGARRIDAAFMSIPGTLLVQFRDDGTGYPGAASGAIASLPFSLSQRVRELGGRIALSQVAGGFGLDIELPCT
jgi:signal transduction histidine kinase